MRKIISLLFILLLSILKVNAQDRFRAGVKLGLAATQVDGDTYSGYDKAGIAGGIFVTGKINEKWTASFEMIYIQKGSRRNAIPDQGDTRFYLLQLDYIEVPVLFQYHQKKFIFELGPGFGYLVREREYNEFGELTGKRPFNKTDANLNIGITYNIINNLNCSWRYSYSFLSIRDYASGASRWYNPGERNNVLAFTLTYMFGNEGEE